MKKEKAQFLVTKLLTYAQNYKSLVCYVSILKLCHTVTLYQWFLMLELLERW